MDCSILTMNAVYFVLYTAHERCTLWTLILSWTLYTLDSYTVLDSVYSGLYTVHGLCILWTLILSWTLYTLDSYTVNGLSIL